ncbi:MAG: DUF4142 domain-containing protein [Sphingomonas sp.]|nr:DUF4142 domain-containing protein [Sphingomonas sp. MM-1]MDX3883140.1 DUF4142 domain-containing protein [Sphingomonas sp.]
MKAMLRTASVAGLALALAACGPKAEQSAEGVANAVDQSMEAAGNVAGNAVDATVDALTPTPGNQEFVDKAARGDAFEIAAARLAADHAASQKVKDFAVMMVEAHTQSTAKLKDAAKEARPALTPDASLTRDQGAKLADLDKLKGADFDKAYIAGQVDAHEDALSLLRAYAEKGDILPLKTAAQEIVPIVEKHLDMARTLKNSL